MTEIEAGKLIAVIAEIYPRFLDGRSVESTVSLWHKLFMLDSYQEAEAAVLAYVASDEKGFPPAPGKIRAMLNDLKKPQGDMTETDAWALVKKALRNSLYNSAKEFAALPEEIQRSVGSASVLRDWAAMDVDTLDSVVASNFMRGYRVRSAQVREIQKLPPVVREVFAALGEAMKLPETCNEPPTKDLPKIEPAAEEPQYRSVGEGWKMAKERIAQIRREAQEQKKREA